MGSDTPAQPTPPVAQNLNESTMQTGQAQIDLLPLQLAAQQKYAGQFNQQQLDQLNQFGPAFAKNALDLAQQFAPQYKTLQDTLNPEVGVAQKGLADYLGGNDQADYNALAPGILEQTRAGQSQRGLGPISPLGSIDESVQLAQLKQSLKDRRINVQLSTAGRVPIGGMQQIQQNAGVGQLVNSPSADAMLSYQNGLNNFSSSIFNTQGGIYGSQLQNQGDPLGSILGGVAGGFTGIGTGFGANALSKLWK